MQVLIAFVMMGLIGVAAVVLTAAAALIQFLPLLAVVLAVLGALRWWERRGHHRRVRFPASGRPAPPSPPIPPRLGGWLMVPVWVDPGGRAQRSPVIDGEVISVEEHDG
jgi:hypothetical protein